MFECTFEIYGFYYNNQLKNSVFSTCDTLKKGGEVSLIHRSKVVGVIKPQKEPKVLTKTDIKQIKVSAEKLHLPNISYKERKICIESNS